MIPEFQLGRRYAGPPSVPGHEPAGPVEQCPAAGQETLERVYEYVVAQPVGRELDGEAAAGLLGLTAAEFGAAVEQLTAWGLLRTGPGRELIPVSPDVTVSRLLGPLEREIRARRLQIEEQRRRLMAFLPLFEAGRSARRGGHQVELLSTLDEVRAVIAELVEQSTTEILTAQPGGGRREDVLEEAAPRDIATLRKGVEMRILYQHTARYSRGTSSYVEQVTRLGAQVRTLDDQFMRLLVFDRQAALIPVPDNPNAAALVRDPHVVAFMVESYERLWLAADPLVVDAESHAEITDDLKEAIVRLLSEGMTDAAVARRLGMSVRTCRRHVAEIMAALDAESRFQAGYLLALQQQAP
ncbi:helix-turn-helix domain-containing protein [Streptomyces sp. NRRL F-4489]|uniref:helix-turn-helix domain-containing protein n=1 Tax=Streptomyces sp. NRRL F-4489 TaxID=1609095 RepID=UPI000D14D153|nr:helix-turn-helix transcriptional regulator [Streptomyces sp. NRRL F-4489]